MKRRILGYVAVMVTVICLCAAPSFAADNYKVGVGYQGMFAGNMLNGLSVRGWFGPNTAIGVEGNVFYGAMKAETSLTSDELDADLWMGEIKAMYAFLVKPNSRFYAGMKLGYGEADIDVKVGGTKVNIDPDFWEIGVLVGSEFSLPFMPEVAFNFDVGYNYMDTDSDVNVSGMGKISDIDLDLDGVFATWGIKYYF